MGLVGTATRAIWLFAAVSVMGSVVALSLDLLATDVAMTTLDGPAAARLDARLDDAIFCFDPGLAQVEASVLNVGGPIDITNTTVLVDGVPDSGTTTSVDGIGETPVWPPGDVARFTFDAATEPERVLLVTPEGISIVILAGTCPVLTTAVISPSSASVVAGEQLAFEVQGYDQFGEPIDGYTFAWSTNGGSVATVDDTTGLLTASTTAATGRTITATAGLVTATAAFDIIPDDPASVTVAPSPATVPAGGTQAFTATVRDQYGNAIPGAPVAWTTNTGTISSAGVLTAPTAPASGRTVTATTTGGVSGTASVTIVPGALSSITVTPPSVGMLTGTRLTFTAQGYDQYGNARTGDTFTWTTTGGTITSGGNLTAPSTTGTVTVRATSGSVQGASTVTVTKQTHVSAMATYSGNTPQTVFAKGTTVTTRVTIVDHANLPVSGATVNIEIRDPSNGLRCNCSAVTNASGVATITYNLPNANLQGQWSIRTTLVTLSGTSYVPSANVVTTINFTEA